MGGVVVFGGTRGIGKAIADKFLGLSHKVAVVSRNRTNVEGAVEDLKPKGAIYGFVGNVENESEVKGVLSNAEKEMGNISVLVNSAGINLDKLLVKMKQSEIEEIVKINLIGTILTSKMVLPYMIKQKSGAIINIGSIIGLSGNAGQCAYSAAKAGIVGFTKSLAKEVGSRGIRVNAVLPGFIHTEMTADVDEVGFNPYVPLRRMGKPQEVAEAVCFLSSNPYVTGEALIVDGGLHLNI